MEYVLSELSEKVATARAAKRTLRIRGGATRSFYGNPWTDDAAAGWLDTSAYRGVVSYEPSELVLTARAGTPLSEVEATLAQQGQMLAFEPPRFGPSGTLGGCVASGLAGPRRMVAGSVADFVLGTRLLAADGNVLRFGGEVMKNVAGYDLSRLLAGSLGVLGAIVEVSLKVLPRPRCEASVVLALAESEALQQCLKWRSRPIPVSATAWEPGPDAAGRLTVRLSGNESAVKVGLADIGGDALPAEQAEAFWLALRDQTHPFFSQAPLWRVVLPAKVPPLDLGPALHEWQGSLRWIAGPQDAAALRARAHALGGSACLYHRGDVPATVPAFQPLSGALLQLHRRIKQELDPAGLFNPHRLVPEF